jgi:hypothetical protein
LAIQGSSGFGRRWFNDSEIRWRFGSSPASCYYISPGSSSSGPCTVWTVGVSTSVRALDDDPSI